MMMNAYWCYLPIILQLNNDIKSELRGGSRNAICLKNINMKKETMGIDHFGGAKGKKIKWERTESSGRQPLCEFRLELVESILHYNEKLILSNVWSFLQIFLMHLKKTLSEWKVDWHIQPVFIIWHKILTQTATSMENFVGISSLYQVTLKKMYSLNSLMLFAVVDFHCHFVQR